MSENQPPKDDSAADEPTEAEAQPTEASGSRWENDEAEPAPVAEPPSYVSDDHSASEGRSRWFSGKAGLIGAALGLLLVSGIGGFAIGHATADDGDHGRFESERRWHGPGSDDRPMPPGGEGPGFDRGERPDFGQEIDPEQDGDADPGSSDSDQDDSSTQG